MKLNKEQKQKIVLGVMMLVGGVYAFFEFLLGPLYKSRDLAAKNGAALNPKIVSARGQIAKTKELENKLPAAKKFTAQVITLIPDGSPVAWFPPKVGEYFKRHGIEKFSVRNNSETAEKDIPGFRKLSWGMEIPRADFVPFAKAVAEMENEEPLFEIQAIDIEVDRDEVQMQRVNLGIVNLVSQ